MPIDLEEMEAVWQEIARAVAAGKLTPEQGKQAAERYLAGEGREAAEE